MGLIEGYKRMGEEVREPMDPRTPSRVASVLALASAVATAGMTKYALSPEHLELSDNIFAGYIATAGTLVTSMFGITAYRTRASQSAPTTP